VACTQSPRLSAAPKKCRALTCGSSRKQHPVMPPTDIGPPFSGTGSNSFIFLYSKIRQLFCISKWFLQWYCRIHDIAAVISLSNHLSSITFKSYQQSPSNLACCVPMIRLRPRAKPVLQTHGHHRHCLSFGENIGIPKWMSPAINAFAPKALEGWPWTFCILLLLCHEPPAIRTFQKVQEILVSKIIPSRLAESSSMHFPFVVRNIFLSVPAKALTISTTLLELFQVWSSAFFPGFVGGCSNVCQDSSLVYTNPLPRRVTVDSCLQLEYERKTPRASWTGVLFSKLPKSSKIQDAGGGNHSEVL